MMKFISLIAFLAVLFHQVFFLQFYALSNFLTGEARPLVKQELQQASFITPDRKRIPPEILKKFYSSNTDSFSFQWEMVHWTLNQSFGEALCSSPATGLITINFTTKRDLLHWRYLGAHLRSADEPSIWSVADTLRPLVRENIAQAMTEEQSSLQENDLVTFERFYFSSSAMTKAVFEGLVVGTKNWKYSAVAEKNNYTWSIDSVTLIAL